MQVKNFNISAKVEVVTDEELKVKQIVENHGMRFRKFWVDRKPKGWFKDYNYVCFVNFSTLTSEKVTLKCYEVTHDVLIVAEAVKRVYGKEVEIELEERKEYMGWQ